MSVLRPIQSHDHEGEPMSKGEKLRWEGFVEKMGFEPGMKKWWMMRVEMMAEMGWEEIRDESRQDWLGWRNKSGSWFQRRFQKLSHFLSTAPYCSDPSDDIWWVWLTWLVWKATSPPDSLVAMSLPWNRLALPQVPPTPGPAAYHGCPARCVHGCDPPNKLPNLSYTWLDVKKWCPPPPVRCVSVVKFRKTRLIDDT